MNGRNPFTWKAAALPLAAATAAFSVGIAYFAGGGPRDTAPAAPAAELKFDSGPQYAPGSNPMARAASSQGGSSIDMFRQVNSGYYSESSKPAPAASKAVKPRNRKEMEEFLRQVRHEIKYDAAAAPAAGDGGQEEPAGDRRIYSPAGLGARPAEGAGTALHAPGTPSQRGGGAGALQGTGGNRSTFMVAMPNAGVPLHGAAAARQQHEADMAARGSGGSLSSQGGWTGGGGSGGTGMNAGEYGSHGGGSGSSMSAGGGMKQTAAADAPPPAPIEFLWPNSVDFGSLYMYETSARQAIVMNIGNAPLRLGTIENIDDETPFQVEKDGCGGRTLAPGKSCTFVIRFSPRTAKDYITAFYVPSDDEGVSYQSYMEVKGNSKYSPWTAWWHSHWTGYSYGRGNKVDFGMVPEGYSMSETLRISNTSGSDWYGLKLDTSGLPASFKLSGDGCSGVNLPSGQSCAVTVVFTPTAAVNRKFSSQYYGQYSAVNSNTGARVYDPRPKFPPLLMEAPVEANPKGDIAVTASYSEESYYGGRQEVLSVPVSGVSCAPFPVPGLTRIQRYYYFEK